MQTENTKPAKKPTASRTKTARPSATVMQPPREVFTISRRPGWASYGEIKVEIECDPSTGLFTKLGLAVRAAFASGANLSGANLSGANLSGADLFGADLFGANLSRANLFGANLFGANLSGANLSGANLSGADLSGADLYGADLSGAEVRGEPVKQLFASLRRFNDAYDFHAFELEVGGVKVLAGCRWFTVAEYRAHLDEEYADEPKGIETADILDFIEARARALNIALVAPVAEAA